MRDIKTGKISNLKQEVNQPYVDFPAKKQRIELDNSTNQAVELLTSAYFQPTLSRLSLAERAALRQTCQSCATELKKYSHYRHDKFTYWVNNIHQEKVLCSFLQNQDTLAFFRHLVDLKIVAKSISFNLLEHLAKKCQNLVQLTFCVDEISNLEHITLFENHRHLQSLTIKQENHLSRNGNSTQNIINAVAQLRQLKKLELQLGVDLSRLNTNFTSWENLAQMSELVLQLQCHSFNNDIKLIIENSLQEIFKDSELIKVKTEAVFPQRFQRITNSSILRITFKKIVSDYKNAIAICLKGPNFSPIGNYPKLKKLTLHIDNSVENFLHIDNFKLLQLEYLSLDIKGTSSFRDNKKILEFAFVFIDNLSQNKKIKEYEIICDILTFPVLIFTKNTCFDKTETLKLIGRLGKATFIHFKKAPELKKIVLETAFKGSLRFPEDLNLGNLEFFQLTAEPQSDLRFLKKCTKLKKIYLDLYSFSGTEDIKKFNHLNFENFVFENLELLSLKGEFFYNESLRLIQHALQLRILELKETSCSNFNGLKLDNLERLTLINNKFDLRGTTALSSCRFLMDIYIDNENIQDFSEIFTVNCRKLTIKDNDSLFAFFLKQRVLNLWEKLREVTYFAESMSHPNQQSIQNLHDKHYMKSKKHTAESKQKNFGELFQEKNFFTEVQLEKFEVAINLVAP